MLAGRPTAKFYSTVLVKEVAGGRVAPGARHPDAVPLPFPQHVFSHLNTSLGLLELPSFAEEMRWQLQLRAVPPFIFSDLQSLSLGSGSQ